ncbi:hypothetical protein HHI36_003445 [Cryptolaemus montrouzieri]|uniref:ATPase AAA-type core domain-containing protein n=1 Tax=Cryptolaemus montrouzieri TaxID=559131 RepID=A0ABD2PE58_9CUCU
MIKSVNSERRESDVEPKDETFNIFINNVDSFHGKYILSCLYKQGFEEMKVENPETTEEMPPTDAVSDEETNYDDSPSTENVSVEEIEDNENIANVFNFDEFSAKSKGAQTVSKYKIFGSLSKVMSEKPDELFEVISEGHEQFKNVITQCDCVIYDISLDESQINKALSTLTFIEQEVERRKGTSTKQSTQSVLFILISTAMTWALTPRMDAGDLSPLPFTESDFHKRKPHPNYKEHYDCEREVIQKGRRFRGRLRTFVICSGITYGHEEKILSFLFKRAWANNEYLPIFGNGTNVIPLIHVADLAKVVSSLVDHPGIVTKIHYILAVEQTPTSIKFVVKYISRALGSGKIQYVPLEEAFLYSDITTFKFDHITADIMMEPEFIIETLNIDWSSEMNLVENIEDIVDEFKVARNLHPLKILIHGPPCCGKTKLAHLLAQKYNLRYISVKSILDSMENQLAACAKTSQYSSIGKSEHAKSRTSVYKERSRLSVIYSDKLKEIEGTEELFERDEEDSEEESYHRAVNEENRKLIPKDYFESPMGLRVSDEQIILLLRREMWLNCSQNQGYVLDGFPKTLRQAIELFKCDNHKFSLSSNDTSRSALRNDMRLIPNYIISLDASDHFLFDRISKAPENAIQNTHYNERDMIRRLIHFREHNSFDTGVCTYFQDCDTDVVEINVSEFPSEDMACILYICSKILGPPRGFGLTSQESEELATAKDYQEKLGKEREELEEKLKRKMDETILDEKMKHIIMKNHLENIRENRVLGPKIEKFRQFMAKKILPIVSEAIMVLVGANPEDPVDFLAEYLFKYNPNGKMFNPMYTRDGEILINEENH